MRSPLALAATLLTAGLWAQEPAPGQWFELETFIVEETARQDAETLSPAAVTTTSFFGNSLGVEEIPRSLAVLTPQLMELLGLESYDELDRFGAGTQRINYFGLAGSAFLRGMRAGTYFNGMLRAYQRNEMPMSFGALEGLEIIKGPVPAGFSPTMVGGGVNQRPKSPYFAGARGEVEIGIGSWDERKLTLDYGAPMMLAGRPAAYRASFTHYSAERFYRDVPHAYDSLYLALTTRLSPRNRLSVAAEIYDFRSSEIPGINRPTQALIDRGEYVIGEPPGLTSAAWGGNIVRPLLEFPYTLTLNPALFALAVPGDVARARIAPELLATMRDLRDPAVLADVYRVLDPGQIAPFARDLREAAAALLADVDIRPQDAYLYTPEFFAAGGAALTTRLPRDRVLADPQDYANSRDYLAFAELETRLDPDRKLVSKVLFERLYTDKSSTYGFAFRTSQWVANLRSEIQQRFAEPSNHLALGIDLRFTRARVYQDFDAEPFSRRDLSLDGISANSIVLAGGQRGPDGLNYWSTFGTASEQSDLWQSAVYAGGSLAAGERLTWHYGARAEWGNFRSALPQGVERASEQQRADRRNSGDVFLYSVHLNPVVKLGGGWFGYATAQFSKAIAPGDGGSVSGKTNFTDAELFEAGIKANLADGRIFVALAGYHWDQATFSSRDASAQPLRASGIELEFTLNLHDRFTLIGAATAQRIHYRSELLGFGALPQDETGWALNGGILNADAPRSAPDNPSMVYAGMPERSAHLYAVFELPHGLRLFAGPEWRAAFYHDMQRAMKLPSHLLWSAQLRYEAATWWLALRVENVFDKFHWVGQEPVFSAGTLVLQGEGRKFELRAGYRF